MSKIEVGDYVLATKYLDGDPCDRFYVGFVKEILIQYNPVRYDVADNAWQSARGNGFRKAVKITKEEGHFIVNVLIPEIGDKAGKSVWWHLRQLRKNGIPKVDE